MKELIKWDKKLSVHINKIDNQHHEFIDLINSVYDISKSKKQDFDKVDTLLRDLLEYARIHFTTEEKYFLDWNYIYRDEHMKEHEKLTLKSLQFYDKFRDGNKEIIPEFLDFLKDWLVNHLEKHDFKYRDLFIEQGLIK